MLVQDVWAALGVEAGVEDGFEHPFSLLVLVAFLLVCFFKETDLGFQDLLEGLRSARNSHFCGSGGAAE